MITSEGGDEHGLPGESVVDEIGSSGHKAAEGNDPPEHKSIDRNSNDVTILEESPLSPLTECNEQNAEKKNVMKDVLLAPYGDRDVNLIYHGTIEPTGDMISLDIGSEVSVVETTEDATDICTSSVKSGGSFSSPSLGLPECTHSTTNDTPKDDSLIRDCVEKEMEKFSEDVYICYSRTLDSPSESNSSTEYVDETTMATHSLSSYLNDHFDEVTKDTNDSAEVCTDVKTLFQHPDYRKPEQETKVRKEADETRKMKNRQHAKNSRARLKADRLELEKINVRLERVRQRLTEIIMKRRKCYIELNAWLLGHSPCVQQTKEWKKKKRKKHPQTKSCVGQETPKTMTSQEIEKSKTRILTNKMTDNKRIQEGMKHKKTKDDENDTQYKKMKTTAEAEKDYGSSTPIMLVKYEKDRKAFEMTKQKDEDVDNIKNLPKNTTQSKRNVYDSNSNSNGTLDTNRMEYIKKGSCSTKSMCIFSPSIGVKTIGQRYDIAYGLQPPKLDYKYINSSNSKNLTIEGRKINTTSHRMSSSQNKSNVSTLEFKMPLPRPIRYVQ